MSDTSHLGGTALVGDPMTMMPDVFQYLIDNYAIKSVLDIGCGVGKNARWFLDHGISAHGIEGFPDYIRHAVIPMANLYVHDYTKGSLIPSSTFDLGWSSEFVEHVEERYAPNFMATFKRCHYVCMTHATPGQGGYHHVNEQPADYWITKMEDAGFKHLAEDSAWMQATGPNTHYGRRTLMLFHNVLLPHRHSTPSMDIWEYYRRIVKGSAHPEVIEIGAADGGDTEKLALGLAATGKKSRLLAFECETKNIPAIKKRNIAGLELFEMAVSDKCGMASFIGSGSWAYSGSLKEPKLHRVSHAWIPFQPPVDVPCVTLDNVFQTCQLDQIDFIWMDVQGAEDLVIAGGQEALLKTRYLYTEIYEAEEYTGQIGRVEILKRLPGNWSIVEDWGGDVLFENLALVFIP